MLRLQRSRQEPRNKKKQKEQMSPQKNAPGIHFPILWSRYFPLSSATPGNRRCGKNGSDIPISFCIGEAVFCGPFSWGFAPEWVTPDRDSPPCMVFAAVTHPDRDATPAFCPSPIRGCGGVERVAENVHICCLPCSFDR